MQRKALFWIGSICLLWGLVLVLALSPGVANGEGAPPGLTGGSLAASGASFLGEERGAYAGNTAAGVGDVNGDGYDDLLVASYQYSSSTGRVYLILGSPGGWQLDEGLNNADAIYTGENTFDLAGFSLAGAGDVNGDGYDDMLIGASFYSTWIGRAYLVLGSGTPSSIGLGSADAIYTGENTNDYAGCSVAGVGDTNGDGYDDMLIGAYGYPSGGDTGRAYLVLGSGTPSSIGLGSADAIYTGENTSDYAGRSVAGAGDMNGDGYDDLLIGAYGYSSDTGRAYLVLGSGTPSSIGLAGADAVYTGENTGDYAGWSVAGAGDMNGDGYGDLLVGAYYYGAGGGAYLVLGGSSPSSMGLGSADAIYTGENSGDSAGHSVAGAGDTNGDGYGDLLIGAYGYSSDTGRAYLVLGSGTPSSIELGGADAIYTGENIDDHAGWSVAGAGDMNGDGYGDMFVGAFWFDSNRGKAYLVFSDYDSAAAARYRALQTVAHGPVEVGHSGVTAAYRGDAPPGSVYATRHYRNTCGTNYPTNGLLWSVESQRGTGAAVFTFRYNGVQIGAWDERDLKLYYRDRPCDDWTQDPDAEPDTEHNRISTGGSVYAPYREYTIAPAPPSPTALGPTAVGVTLAQEPPWAVIGLAVLVISAAAARWRGRRTG
jgi:hypothetical protein